MKYFENFPKIEYPYYGKMVINPSIGKTDTVAVDLTIRFKFIDSILNNPHAYYTYYWKDGTRPDILARQYYGDADLAWLVMMSASVFDWTYDLPLEPSVLDEYMKTKYDSSDIYQLQSQVHHCETGLGYTIDSLTYATLTDPNKRTVSVYDYEVLANDAKRNIKLIAKSYVPQILEEFGDKLNEISYNRSSALINATRSIYE